MNLTISRETISLAAAQALVAAALAEAGRLGIRIAVSVADREGSPVTHARMDEVPAPISDFAAEKAYTAAVTGAATHDFFAHIDSSPSLRMGLTGRSKFLVWSGGLPLVVNGNPVGGIGVSGGSEEQDIACARAALAVCGLPSAG